MEWPGGVTSVDVVASERDESFFFREWAASSVVSWGRFEYAPGILGVIDSSPVSNSNEWSVFLESRGSMDALLGFENGRASAMIVVLNMSQSGKREVGGLGGKEDC